MSHPPSKDREFREKAEQALQNTKKHRGRASPETLMIRRIVEHAMIKRFRLQCALPNSPLFGKVPPRRLNEALFSRACHSPLQCILQNNAKALAKVPAGKVVKNCKWKIRKMRGNVLGKDVTNFVFNGNSLCTLIYIRLAMTIIISVFTITVITFTATPNTSDDGFDFNRYAQVIDVSSSSNEEETFSGGSGGAFSPFVAHKRRRSSSLPSSKKKKKRQRRVNTTPRDNTTPRQRSSANTTPRQPRDDNGADTTTRQKSRADNGAETTTRQKARADNGADTIPRQPRADNRAATTTRQKTRTDNGADTTPRQPRADNGADTTARQTRDDNGADQPRVDTTPATPPQPRADNSADTTPRQLPSADDTTPQKFVKDDRVMALWNADKRWYPATILTVKTYKNGNTRYRVSCSCRY